MELQFFATLALLVAPIGVALSMSYCTLVLASVNLNGERSTFYPTEYVAVLSSLSVMKKVLPNAIIAAIVFLLSLTLPSDLIRNWISPIAAIYYTSISIFYARFHFGTLYLPKGVTFIAGSLSKSSFVVGLSTLSIATLWFGVSSSLPRLPGVSNSAPVTEQVISIFFVMAGALTVVVAVLNCLRNSQFVTEGSSITKILQIDAYVNRKRIQANSFVWIISLLGVAGISWMIFNKHFALTSGIALALAVPIILALSAPCLSLYPRKVSLFALIQPLYNAKHVQIETQFALIVVSISLTSVFLVYSCNLLIHMVAFMLLTLATIIAAEQSAKVAMPEPARLAFEVTTLFAVVPLVAALFSVSLNYPPLYRVAYTLAAIIAFSIATGHRLHRT